VDFLKTGGGIGEIEWVVSWCGGSGSINGGRGDGGVLEVSRGELLEGQETKGK